MKIIKLVSISLSISILLISCALTPQPRYNRKQSEQKLSTEKTEEITESPEDLSIEKKTIKPDSIGVKTKKDSIEIWSPISKFDIIHQASPQKLQYQILRNGLIDSAYVSEDTICFQKSDNYSSIKGITTYRGNNYRSSSFVGEVAVEKESLKVAWRTKIGKIDNWSGIGWTGQPAVIRWEDSIKQLMNISSEKKKKNNLSEIIYSALDGNIYFLDIDDGKQTRNPIKIGYPLKGSVMIDPRGFPLLFQGIGINKNGSKEGEFQYRIYELIDQQRVYYFQGIPQIADRRWGAFDSSALIDAESDRLILCGENGLIYNTKLNTNLDMNKKCMSINPISVNYRYKNPYRNKIGFESSPAIYKNLLFAADNGGLLQCINLNTMKPVWMSDLEDDTDASIVLEETNEGVYLYSGNENDLRGKKKYDQFKNAADRKNIKNTCSIRKFNALTGEKIWEKQWMCYYHSTNGGALGTPVIGKNEIDDLVIFNLSRIDGINKGRILALDKETGNLKWEIFLNYFSWCSPACFYSNSGKAYLVFGDYVGNFYLVEAKTGNILHRISLNGTIECSPVVYNDKIILGTKNKEIICLRIE